MARTRSFRAVGRALLRARRDRGLDAPRALSRRRFLIASAGLAGLAACQSSITKAQPIGGRRIAIVGGGAAGLTAAHRLAGRGAEVSVYEASGRFGGRMFTQRDFTADGQFCELGGELVDSNHAALRALAQELGVGIDRLAPENDPGVEHLHIDGVLRSSRDLYDEAAKTGAVVPIVERIAIDQGALLDADDNWTERARALDAMSLRAYLDGLRGVAEPWALEFLDLAYRGEYGIATERQSALNLVDFITADLGAGFEMFGESDEAWRVRGGSSTLTDALVSALDGRAALTPKHALRAIEREASARLRLRFDGPQGPVAVEADAVVLAVPFTRLRAVSGIETLGFGALTLRAIRELGMGQNAKVMIATRGRPWRGEPGAQLPEPSNGSFYSNRGMEAVWETSRGQAGANGVLTNFLSRTPEGEPGATADDLKTFALDRMERDLRAISPAIADSLNRETTATFFWAVHPHTLGSYAGALMGQYTTLLDVVAEPAAAGRVQLAGEQTSVDFIGYMNGAVESGERAAQALAAAFAA